MVGFSPLTEPAENATLAHLKIHRLELVDAAITKNKGRIIKTAGEGCCSSSAVSPKLCTVQPRFRSDAPA